MRGKKAKELRIQRLSNKEPRTVFETTIRLLENKMVSIDPVHPDLDTNLEILNAAQKAVINIFVKAVEDGKLKKKEPSRIIQPNMPVGAITKQ